MPNNELMPNNDTKVDGKKQKNTYAAETSKL